MIGHIVLGAGNSDTTISNCIPQPRRINQAREKFTTGTYLVKLLRCQMTNDLLRIGGLLGRWTSGSPLYPNLEQHWMFSSVVGRAISLFGPVGEFIQRETEPRTVSGWVA